MAAAQPPAFDPVAALLGDLNTITSLARAGIQSAPEPRLQPGETRPAAILFVDVVGFTPLSRVLDTEQLSTLIDRTFRIFELSAQAHGGYCDKVIGDAALYVFAGHIACEPPCQGALRAALALRRRIAQVNQALADSALRLEVRCGVSYGTVTRQRIGGAGQQITVMGETVNLAQRLQAAAEPGTVCTTAEVLDECGELFESAQFGELELKGFGPVAVLSVSGEHPRQVELRGRGQISLLVGRDELLEHAEGIVAGWINPMVGQAAAPVDPSGQAEPPVPPPGNLLVLRGATAVGKSRMAWELLKRLQARFPLATATAHCTLHGGLVEFCAELCRVAGLTAENVAARWPEQVGRAFLPVMGSQPETAALQEAHREQLLTHLPLLAYVLGADGVDTGGIRQADSASFALACKLALKACCEVASAGNPVILVIEDLQWLGERAELLAGLLAETQISSPLTLIGTLRSTAPADALDALREAAGAVEVLDVESLTPRQGTELMAHLLPGVELPERIEAELHEKSLGLPYYYEEMARLLLRSGMVEEDRRGGAPAPPADQPQGWAGSTDPAADAAGREPQGGSPTGFKLAREVDTLAMPADLRSLILGRLDLLPAELRELAACASVLGRSFELADLVELRSAVGDGAHVGEHHVGAKPASPAPDSKHLPPGLLQTLHALVAQRILATPDDAKFFFEHYLTHEAIYSALLSSNRRVLHGAAAEVTRARIVPGTAAEWDLLPELYRHLDSAAFVEDAANAACDMLMLMARNERYAAWDEWIARLKETVAAALAGSTLLEARIAWAEAVREIEAKQVVDAQAKLEQALLAAQAQGATAMEVAVMIDLGHLYRQNKDVTLALGYLSQAIDIARALGSLDLEAEALASQADLHKDHGSIRQAIASYKQAITVFAGRGNELRMAQCRNRLGACYVDAGDYDQAIGEFSQSREGALRVGNRRAEAGALSNLGVAWRWKGDLAKAAGMYQAGAEIARQIGWKRGEAFNLMNTGDLLFELDKLPEAQAALSSASSIFTELDDAWPNGIVLSTLGEVLIRMGQLPAAREALESADNWMRTTDDAFRRGLIQCSWVRYHLADGDHAAAKSALARARALSAKAFQADGSFLEKEIVKAATQISSPAQVS